MIWPPLFFRHSLGEPTQEFSIEFAMRLQTVLGDAYRVQRELGGGGMSRVFLADEHRLGRQVVIKVLPPEMGAGVNAERFEREIQLAARLQHPHIVPLLTAGASGDLLYYVMPYIAGESLRVKLAREGELPVAEAVRVLREVVQALAYAHRHGVVHRDIKPDNILLADGFAVVTDFGVAKAVSASTGVGGTSLTSLGMALGTPAYMAPEQAAADPHVDHRADLYAVGALGYEMLCGRPPFVETTPQAVLAAHLTRAPDPVSRYRPNVSPQLEALVARCLEKRPADRWQTAAELVPPLDAMAAPSGGTTPTTPQPVVSAATEQAIRRGHPVRVALLFAAASVVVLAAVAFLMYRLGLPDWVLGAAGMLLLIGLPIMLVTGLHERRRAAARTTAVITPTESGPARWFTWRRALLGGGLAFAGLAAVAGVYTAMRLLGIGPVGTLLASGALEERDRILLADFENRTADSTLGGSLTEALRVDLSQSPTLRLVDAAEVGEALRRMQRPSGTAIDAEVAREIAEREGVKAIVTGQVDPVGTGYVLSANLLSAPDGRALVAVRERAADASALLDAIDKLSAKLRERIGESLVTIRANPPLEQVTTTSLAALRAYSEGTRLVDLGNPGKAIPVLQEAVALDSGFAMAYRKLAVAIGNSGGSREEELAAVTRAYQLRDRLPAEERELATAYYHGQVDVDPVVEAETYRSLLRREPDNESALNNLALVMNRERRFAEAESLGLRLLQVGRSDVDLYYDKVIFAQVGQGRIEDARKTAERAAAVLPPGSPGRTEFQVLVALAERDYEAADSLNRRLWREQEGNLEWEAQAVNALASLAVSRGRLQEAVRLRNEQMRIATRRGLPRDYLVASAEIARLELLYRNRPGEALTIVQTALARYPLDSMSGLDRPYLPLAAVHAGAGKLDQARRLLREYETVVPEGVRRGERWQGLVYGRMFEAEGKLAQAAEAYRDAHRRTGLCGSCGLFELASLLDRQGKTDSARVVFEEFVNTPTAMGHLIADQYAVAPSYKRLGELYEAKGDRKKAADYYGRFLDLWKDADPELQGGVREVRQRLARLAQEPGT
jgi:tetratricopeptide (TPR) repeat protein/tRNA A-37 threonylcarbamoyl transferase component Bud32